MDLEAFRIQPSYIRRLTRILESLRPLEEAVQESERIWEANFSIAGWQYYKGESILQTLRIGNTVILRAELNNRYDPNAVEIFIERDERELKLGYVPRYLSLDIKSRIEIRQVRVTISSISPSEPPHNKVHVYCVDRQ